MLRLSVEHSGYSVLFVTLSGLHPQPLSEEWLSYILLSTLSQFINFLTFSFTIYLFSSYTPHSILLFLQNGIHYLWWGWSLYFCSWPLPLPSYLLKDLTSSAILLYRAFPVPFSLRYFSHVQCMRCSRP